MTMLVLATAVMLAVYLTFVVHAVRGRGAKVVGVPRPLWVLALATFDPLILGAYLLFVVFGVSRNASWRRWVVYGACAFVVVVRFVPVVVPASGSYPEGSARPFAWIPAELKMSVDYGGANSTASSTKMWGPGWVVRDVLIVGDGHPVSAAVVDQVASSLEAAGIPEVRFVQSTDLLPAQPADLVVAVSVHDVSAYDLVAASHWSGRVQVSMGWRPFSFDTWATDYDRFVERGGAGFDGSWRISSTRFGPVWGAAYYDHVVGHVRSVGASIAGAFRDAYTGGRVEVRAVPEPRAVRDPGVATLLASYEPQALLRGPGLLRDAQATWKIELGDDPAAAVQDLASKLEQAGWDVTASDVNRWWQLSASRDVDGNHQYLRVRPSRDWEVEWGEQAQPPTTYAVAFHDRYGTARLGDLAESLMDSGEDDYLLRMLGESVPDPRYQEWRRQVLSGDVGVPNLLHVARLDAKRGNGAAGKELIRVAAWLTQHQMVGIEHSSELRELVETAAKSAKVEAYAGEMRPSLEVLQRAGVPLLGDRWLRLPYLSMVRNREMSHGVAHPVRRFIGLDADRKPVLLDVRLIGPMRPGAKPQVELGAYLAGGARSRHNAEHMAAGVSSTPDGDRLEVRTVDEHVEVRWVLQGK